MLNLIPLLKEVAIFRELRVTELVKIAEKMQRYAFVAGERLCEEGAPGGEALGIIESGYVNVTVKAAAANEEKILTTLGPAATFGEISLLTGETHSASIIAISNGVLYRIKKEDFDAVIKEIPALGLFLGRVISKKFRDSLQVGKGLARKNKIIAVVSAEKGLGKSTLIANLATSLSRQTGGKTIAIDLNYSAGSLASILNLQTPLSLHKFIQSGQSFSFADLEAATVRHPQGLNVLGIMEEFRGDALSQNFLPQLLEIPAGDPGLMFKVLAEAAEVVLLVSPQIEKFADTVDFIKFLKQGDGDLDRKLKLVVQSDGRIAAATKKQFEKLLRLPVSEIVPYDGVLADLFSISATPFVASHPLSEISQVVNRLARELGGIKIGLALSSGMAPGLAHIGVLKVLERAKIPIDILSGSSGGSIFAAGCAAGIPAIHMEKMACEFYRKFLWVYADFAFPFYSGLIRGDALFSFFGKFLKEAEFSDLKVPLKIVASDLQNGEPVVLDEGKVNVAIRASVSVPGIFSPVKVKGRFLVDGAAISPVPVSVLQQSGANIVIAVNVNSPLNDQSARPNIFDVVMLSRAISAYRMAELDSARADVVIKPETTDFRWRDYARAKEIIKRGEAAAEKAVSRIKDILSVFSLR
ncbi:MAG: patatin-like phospholipase family protein [Candidatus Margulisiibacteriota bacterium]